MIRVLHIMSWGLGLAGTEAIVMNYYRYIDRSKVQFDFLIPENAPDYHEAEAVSLGARVYRIKTKGKTHGKNRKHIWPGLFRFLRDHKEYKIVHIHHDHPKILRNTVHVALSGVPVRIVQSHNVLQLSRKKRLLRPLLGYFATHWLGDSTEAGVSLFGQIAGRSRKFQVCPNARNLELYRYNPAVRQQMRSNLLLEDRLVLVNVANLIRQKNQMFLLDIISHARKENPGILLIIAGEGKLRKELEEKIITMGLDDNVKLLGRRNDVSELLQASDIFVMPSFHEGLPGVAIEAQTAGLPCLLSDKITNEVKLTDIAEFLPIDKGPEVWAERIAAYRNFVRRDTSEDVRKAGYDVKDAARWLEKYYLSSIKQQSYAEV